MSNSDIIRAFFLAHGEGRLEDMLALVHPSVLWQPETPLRRDFYSGHEGTLALFQDMRDALGPFSCQLVSLVELDASTVHVVGWQKLLEGGEERGPQFETWITVQDGRLAAQSSTPADGRS
ncbi:MAG: hypothetical protein JWO12_1954 [Frankiales bacterium]|nr:hypothetical protein [Frankiales bacterium]